MTLADLLRSDVVTVPPDATVADVARTLRDENVGSAVVTTDREPTGIVTDRDLAVRVLAEGEDPAAVTAEDVMTADPATVQVDAGLFDATESMREHGVRRLPVLDGDELAGIVTLDDVVRLLVAELGDLGDVIERESPPY